MRIPHVGWGEAEFSCTHLTCVHAAQRAERVSLHPGLKATRTPTCGFMRRWGSAKIASPQPSAQCPRRMLLRQWAQVAAMSHVTLGATAADSERAAPRDPAATLAHLFLPPPLRGDTHPKGIQLDEALGIFLVVRAPILFDGRDGRIEQAVR